MNGAAFQTRHDTLTRATMRTNDEDGAGAHSNGADAALRASLAEMLGLPADQVAAFTEATALFGSLPELDSMAVATLLTDLEDRLSIVIDDDDIDAEAFETFGSLRDFLDRKLLQAG